MMDNNDFVWTDCRRLAFGIPWPFVKYKLTDEKLIIISGVLSQREEEVRLYRILDLTLKRSFAERLFGLGTIHCCTADKSTPEFNIGSIKDASRVKDMLSDMVEKQRTQKQMSVREFIDAT